MLAGSTVRDLEYRIEASLIGRNVTHRPRARAAEGLPLRGRRQRGDPDPVGAGPCWRARSPCWAAPGACRRAQPQGALRRRPASARPTSRPQHGLLPGRLDARGPRRPRPAHAAVRARAGARARRAQDRARADRPVHGPRRAWSSTSARPSPRAGSRSGTSSISASHTHSGPAATPTSRPSTPPRRASQTATDPLSASSACSTPARPTASSTPSSSPDRRRDRRADDDLGPAAAGWGSRGIWGSRATAASRPTSPTTAISASTARAGSRRPGGYEHTIDPAVNVLRVDKIVRRRVGRKRRPHQAGAGPIGGWSTFADHGTVTKSTSSSTTRPPRLGDARCSRARAQARQGAAPPGR